MDKFVRKDETMNVDKDELLSKLKELLKGEVSTISYDTWFAPLGIDSIKDEHIVFTVNSEFQQDFIENKFNNLIFNTLRYITNKEWTFSVIDLSKNQNDNQTIIADKKSNVSDTELENNHQTLNPKYTFETFVVGNNNRFAHAAALAVGNEPGKSYNPLFLYGKSGLGKTHLMHSIGNYIIENSNLKVLYISSDKFVNDFINAVRYNEKDNFDKIDVFKNKYRNIDVLMIDDIQFLGNATKGQEEFFHTFNELYNENKQIVIASDRSVDDLKMLENRLLTRFNWGLTANITPPDFELRVNIIKKKISHQESAKDVPIEVIEYIANNFASDVRQLEGAITRVFAYALMMNKGKIDLDIAIDALKDQLTDKSVYKNDVHRIQTVVCDYFKITIEDIKGKKRSQNINYPRQVAIYLCRTLAHESFPKIGTYFGGRDHSTIMSSYRKIEKDLKENEQLKIVIKELKEMLST